MKTNGSRYRGYRFPPEIISHSVWLYHRFSLSFRDVEELLAKRGVVVSYETIRQWCRKFGPEYARKLKHRQGRLGDVYGGDETRQLVLELGLSPVVPPATNRVKPSDSVNAP